MHVCTDAATLARALLPFAHARATGQLRISGANERRCELFLVRGRVRALALLDERLARRDVVSALAEALSFTQARSHFQPRRASDIAPLAPCSMSELLLCAAERALTATCADPLRDVCDGALLERSAFGSALCRDGTRFIPPALFVALTRGELRLPAERLSQLTPSEQSRLRAALWLGALVERREPSRSAYALLLRKHQQLRTRADARTLLELAPEAPASDARRALRKLAARLHPDTLGPAAPDALRALCTELLCALTHAERTVRRQARA